MEHTPKHTLETDFKKAAAGAYPDELIDQDETVEDQKRIEKNDPTQKFIPIENVSEEIEEEENKKFSREDKENLFKEFKDEQNKKLASVNSDISLYDLYFRDISVLEDLQKYLSLKGKEQYQKGKIDTTAGHLKKDQKAKWRESRQILSEEIVKQDINQKKFLHSEWDRPQTSAVLVKKFKLDLLDKQERSSLLQVIVDILDVQPRLGRGVAVEPAKAEQRRAHKDKAAQSEVA